jgi:hypothetical protein
MPAAVSEEDPGDLPFYFTFWQPKRLGWYKGTEAEGAICEGWLSYDCRCRAVRQA